MSDEDVQAGISRRTLLKRGAVVGAAAVWTVPIVQAVSMTPAHADTPSAPSHGTDGGAIAFTPNGPTDPTPATPPKSTGGLAFTGTDVAPLLAGGAAAVAVGATALVAARSRRKDTGEPDQA